MSAWQELGHYRPNPEFRLLRGPSGVFTTPYRIELGRWNYHKERWEDIYGNAWTDGSEEPTHWAEVPR